MRYYQYIDYTLLTRGSKFNYILKMQ